MILGNRLIPMAVLRYDGKEESRRILVRQVKDLDELSNAKGHTANHSKTSEYILD